MREPRNAWPACWLSPSTMLGFLRKLGKQGKLGEKNQWALLAASVSTNQDWIREAGAWRELPSKGFTEGTWPDWAVGAGGPCVWGCWFCFLAWGHRLKGRLLGREIEFEVGEARMSWNPGFLLVSQTSHFDDRNPAGVQLVPVTERSKPQTQESEKLKGDGWGGSWSCCG